MTRPNVQRGRSCDRGSMLILVTLVAIAVCVAVTSALLPVLVDVAHHQQAQSAADAAALAGVRGGRAAAAELAVANGASLVSWQQAGRQVTVVVVVAGQRATARATDEP